MRVTVAQLNPIVGDIDGNLARAIDTLKIAQREGADLVVFPELYLVGYPPRDLLERPWFISRVHQAIQQLAEISADYPETGILIGAPVPTGRDTGHGLANAAVLIFDGKIVAVQEKLLLPTYDVFDEARHFDPAVQILLIPFKDEKLGISICEDAWNDLDFWPDHRLYSRDPIQELADLGATVLINISASPFYLGKDELRFEIVRRHAAKHHLPFIFVNQVGGNDELIFDGGSMCFRGDGSLMAAGPYFKEWVHTADTTRNETDAVYKPLGKTASVYNALVIGVRDYLRKCGFKKAVVGLSGGIDSALTACLAAEALGRENVLGITMPSRYSSGGSVEDSKILAANLGIEFKIIPIEGMVQAYLSTLNIHFEGKPADVTEENIQARIRGNILMAFSNKFGALALSTGNKSELAVGYCTLYGDMSGGLSVISDVPKTLVYELAEFVNRERTIIPSAIIEKAPSAELRPDQKDQDSLPPYPVLDQILSYYIEEMYSPEQITALGFDPEIVGWVARTVDRNEYKRKQAAPGLKVTSKAFGGGRRIPVAKRLQYDTPINSNGLEQTS